MGKTLFDKIWDSHVIREIVPGVFLLHVDRHIVHDLGGPVAFDKLVETGRPVHNPELTLAVSDHTIVTDPGRDESSGEIALRYVRKFREHAARFGVPYLAPEDPRQGIVHVVGPELGFTLPGMVLVCGDSHTGTNGGMGTLAWGIGSTELVSVLVSQAIIQARPRRMRVRFEGALARGVFAKDCALYMIGKLGADGGDGHAIEYAGGAVRAMSVEERLTLCNLSIEFGAKMGMVAADDTTYAYLADKPLAPKGRAWEQALAQWRTLPSDDDAVFDREHELDAAAIGPQVTWGNSPQDVVAVADPIPTPAAFADPARRRSAEAAYAYMDLRPGTPIEGLPIDYAFIGSCTNARLSDLREAAAAIRGGRVPEGVTAWVVPGSQAVKRDAEAEGLDRLFLAAGFQWREPGCSMCSASNGEVVPPGKRSISTTNRNFVGRQGPGARTHLASPAMVAAAAVAGRIVDIRKQGA